MSNAFWLVTVPNEGRTPEKTFERLRAHTDGSSKGYLVQVPSLTVGTLDSLMALSDDMERIDMSIEQAVRKIERQYADVTPKDREPLLIDAVPVDRYLPSFVWEHAKYPHRRALPELVASLRQAVGQVEDELKHLAATYADKTQKLQALTRAAKGGKGASLTLSPLEEVLAPDVVAGAHKVDTEYLVTVIVAVPRAKEALWNDAYASLAADAVIVDGAACSPAVPGSAKKLAGDGEACLYALTLLKGKTGAGSYDGDAWVPGSTTDFVGVYAAAAKASGFTVRPFEYDADKVARDESERQALSTECDRLHAAIVRWCKAHFAESFVAWMHLKVVRAFVESVLRYGLPVDFVTALLVPSKYREQPLQSALDKMFAHLDGEGALVPEDSDEEKYSNYVLQKCTAQMT
jgi:V-type H+-transporting ATPase subunit C|mmetsp:Transcript_34779/g.107621  ORF Transcript_34779/g.107621 Transcript_34779/m.107621 type:complete len:405 (+) Transcript_34779:459-1673(+)